MEIHKSTGLCIPFDQYMALSLYHPEEGYYTSEREKIGKNGDFYTSSSVSSVFGWIWSDVFRRLMHDKNLPPAILEFGAGNGSFAKHVLDRWKQEDRSSYKKLIYHIVEHSPSHRTRIAETLESHSNVHLYESFSAIKQQVERFHGIVYANELLDAMPVKVVRKRNGHLEEMHVSVTPNQTLYELWKPAALQTTAAKRLSKSRNGTRGEVPVFMTKWLHNLYDWLDRKSVVYFVDYGYKEEEWKLPHLRSGSIRGYRKHQLISDILTFTGEMDLTSHVDWETVRAEGRLGGMVNSELMSQANFLLENGILNYLKNHDGSDPFSEEAKTSRAIRSFLLNSELGEGFQVLRQVKA
ncbi:class I SAM-dependent methyltransferase [Fictibacillus iocasae]|uniref:Class I SAM-dependent methyltransferase n=1 Tax=Fictibacillus iocasae TaxID=2715437 RepID=A0ABW2NM78_9BACL